MRVSCALIGAVAGVCGVLHDARAQVNAPQPNDTDYCLGFAFSAWKPALNLEEAGHRPVVDSSRFPRAAGGRDWAATGTKAEGDTTFVLFPIWWPAGVVVSLEHTPKSLADTVRGRAIALVADARKTAPSAVIRAWETPCRR